MLTLTTPVLTFAAPPFEDNPTSKLESYQTNFQESLREKRQGNAPALPFQETLLLDNQYRPDQYQYRSTYRLVGEEGLVKVQRKKVAKKKKTTVDSKIIREEKTTANDVLPTQVLLGRVKVVVTEKPNFSEQKIWAELSSFDRSQKRGGEPHLWKTEMTEDQTEDPSPRGFHQFLTEDKIETLSSPRRLHELQMVNHNLRPRVYFLPS